MSILHERLPMTTMELRAKLDVLFDGECAYLLSPGDSNWSAQVIHKNKHVTVQWSELDGYSLSYEYQKCNITDETTVVDKIVEIITNDGFFRYID